MRRIAAFFSLRLVLVVAGIGFILMLGTKPTATQDISDDECFDFASPCDVEGFSAILGSTDDTEIDTFASTDISFDLVDDDFAADVVAGLFQDSPDNLIDSNEGFDDGSGHAETSMADAVTLGSAYVLEGDHYVDDLLSGDSFEVGSTAVGVVAAAPEITDITPTGATSGTQGQLTVNGSDLFDQFDGTVEVANIPGITWSANSADPDGTQIILNYSIAAHAASGDQSFFLATRFGQSNTVTFRIDDPPPTVTSVQPPDWEAGTQTSITVGGTNFGACPKLSISGPGVSGTTTTSFSDTQIQGTVTVDASSQGGQATVTVTSDGETCNGFNGPPGQPGNASDKAEIDPIKPPAPQIQYFNTTNLPPTVMAGQKMSLSMVTPQLPGDLQVSTLTWSVTGTAIQTFTQGSTTQGDKATALPQTVTNGSSTPNITFYWVSAGQAPPTSYTVSLFYTANNQQNSDTTTATFNVDGPHLSATPLTITTDSVNIFSSNKINPNTGLPFGPILQFGSPNTNGITAQVQATTPAGNPGNYQWIQLINSDKVKMITDDIPHLLTCSSFATPGGAPELDTNYPYPFTKNGNSDTAVDAPGSPLVALRGLVQRVFTANLNFRWVPNPDSANCGTDSSCAIPVPLGSVTWGYSGCAIHAFQSQSNGTNWFAGGPNCPQNSQGASLQNQVQLANPSSGNNFGYPSWQQTVTTNCNPF